MLFNSIGFVLFLPIVCCICLFYQAIGNGKTCCYLPRDVNYLCLKYGLKYYDHTADTSFIYNDYFYDANHLSLLGSKHSTEMIRWK